VLAELATDESDVGVSLFSALSRRGVGDAAQWLHAGTRAGRGAAQRPGSGAPDALLGGNGEGPADVGTDA